MNSPRSSPRPPSRLLAATLAAVAGLAALSAGAAHADTGPTRLPPPPFGAPGATAGDRLIVTVADSGSGSDGTFELRCGPGGGSGTHPDPAGACERLDAVRADGVDPFAPVAKRARCTMQYGGAATGHITGTWHGRGVDASYRLTDGCEISRWNRLVPVLPATAP